MNMAMLRTDALKSSIDLGHRVQTQNFNIMALGEFVAELFELNRLIRFAFYYPANPADAELPP